MPLLTFNPFGPKQEEEEQVPSVTQNFTPAPQADLDRASSPGLLQSIGQTVRNPVNLFNPLAGGADLLSRVARSQNAQQDVRNIASGTADLGKAVVRSPFRFATGLGLDLAQPILNLAIGEENVDQVLTPQTGVERFFLGEEPIKPFLQNAADRAAGFASTTLDETGSPVLAGAALAGGVALGTGEGVLESLIGGGSAAKGGKTIATRLIARYGDEAVQALAALRRGDEAALSLMPSRVVGDVRNAVQQAGRNTSALRAFENVMFRGVDDIAQSTARATDSALPSITRAFDDTVPASRQSVEFVGKAADEAPVLKALRGDETAKITDKYAGSINKTRLGVSAAEKAKLDNATLRFSQELASVKGAPLKHSEVIQEAKKADVLQKVVTRTDTLKFEAALKATRDQLTRDLEKQGITKSLLDNIKVINSYAADAGRRLNSFNIGAVPGGPRIKSELLRDILKVTDDTDAIIAASKGVDFTNPKQATDFYRTFVKPTRTQIIDEMRYINLLSSPKTHSVNFFSNLLQTAVLAPATKLATGGVDKVASMLTGRARETYMREVPAYFKGAFSSVGDATRRSLDILMGRQFGNRPDINFLPTGSKLTEKLLIVPRALEAMDNFFTTIIKSGELESLALRGKLSGKEVDMMEDLAESTAQYFVFRQGLKPGGQGVVLDVIDDFTGLIMRARKLPGVRWFVPFVTTPMNIFKQGLEYSPAGVLTMVGSAKKKEQLAKSIIGTMVFAGAGTYIMNHDSTWEAPSGDKEKEAFYASGRKPYSVRIGDKWVSYSKLGPLAYPIAMAAALKWHTQQDPDRYDTTRLEKLQGVMGSIAGFFSDQSYVQGINTLVNLADEGFEGEQARDKALSTFPSQLIPLSSLVRWVNSSFIDTTFRDSNGPVESLMKQLPGLSTKLEPFREPDGTPSQREGGLLQSITPIPVTPARDEFELDLRKAAGARTFWEELQEQGKEETNAMLREIYNSDREFYNKVEKEIKLDQLGLTREDRAMIGTGVQNGQRAELIMDRLADYESKEEKNEYLQRLWDARILTKDVNVQLAERLSL